MHHWTEHNICVPVCTCVLALQLAHLMRREVNRAGLHQREPDATPIRRALSPSCQ